MPETTAVKVFCFGLGYSARRFLARVGVLEASGATREVASAAALRREGIEAFAFEPKAPDPAMLRLLAQAEILLVSAPPGPEGDPALSGLAPEIAEAPKLKRIVYLSSVGVYGDHAGGWVDETSAARPRSQRARLRLAAEDEWRTLGAARATPVDILRLAGIYGPGRNALLKARAGEARRIVKPGHVSNRIHVDDIAEIARRVIERDGSGEVWNVADEEPGPPQDVVAYACRLIGVSPLPEEPFAAATMSA
ncbi:MAG: SDR family oxidoreductase, partial [Hyphomicrobiales bacterium]|nr:SDR family oxidoreductase [Hyphomicrobiales bacterium]